jgi:hypothetical protein
MFVKYRYLQRRKNATLMDDDDASIAIGNPQSELDDPINRLLVVTNKLVDLESRMDYQSTAIDEIQDSLRSVIDLLEKLKQ